MGGTSATAAVLIRYLPAHMVYRTPDMKVIYDGFMPTSNGATIQKVDVPLIQIPTMTEVSSGTVTARQDGDAPGDQFRVFEFAGMSHVDSRDSVRFKPDPCKTPVSQFPQQAYFSVALNYLFEWVDKGKVPPHADRSKSFTSISLKVPSREGSLRSGRAAACSEVTKRMATSLLSQMTPFASRSARAISAHDISRAGSIVDISLPR